MVCDRVHLDTFIMPIIISILGVCVFPLWESVGMRQQAFVPQTLPTFFWLYGSCWVQFRTSNGSPLLIFTRGAPIRAIRFTIVALCHKYRRVSSSCSYELYLLSNSLWSSDAVVRNRSGPILVQVMACCLTTPSHYLNQCGIHLTRIRRKCSR